MNILRRLPTSRLLTLLAAVVLAVGGGAAVAVAALSSSGPTPPPKALPNAVHDALAAPQVKGVTARISFTNKLIDDSSVEGGGPFLKGATGRLWATKGHLRLELQGSGGNGDAQLVVNDRSFWVYDSGSNTVYKGSLPARKKETGKDKAKEKADHGSVPSVAEIARRINEASKHATISGALPSTVGGQAAYTVRVSPKHDGGLLGAGELAWGAAHGVPLKFAVFAQNSDSPVLELSATDISFGSVPASNFNITPPSSAKVVKVQDLGGKAGAAKDHARRAKGHANTKVHGVAAVQSAVPFKVSAPAKLAGLPRKDVRLLDWGGSKAALVLYGENLGGIAVIERRPDAGKASNATSTAKPKGGRGEGGPRLPSVSINGATGTELATALGTFVQFDRGGVSYTVVGSVPPQAAEAAARGL